MEIYYLLDYDGIATNKGWPLPSKKSTLRGKDRYNENSMKYMITYRTEEYRRILAKSATKMWKVFKAKMVFSLSFKG